MDLLLSTIKIEGNYPNREEVEKLKILTRKHYKTMSSYIKNVYKASSSDESYNCLKEMYAECDQIWPTKDLLYRACKEMDNFVSSL